MSFLSTLNLKIFNITFFSTTIQVSSVLHWPLQFWDIQVEIEKQCILIKDPAGCISSFIAFNIFENYK